MALVVDGQRVVHVEADELDLAQGEVAVDEHLAGQRRLEARGPGEDGVQLAVVQESPGSCLGLLYQLTIAEALNPAVNGFHFFPFAPGACHAS